MLANSQKQLKEKENIITELKSESKISNMKNLKHEVKESKSQLEQMIQDNSSLIERVRR